MFLNHKAMSPVSTKELLEYRVFKNKITGSKVVFDGNHVVINEEVIGRYLLRNDEGRESVVITTPEKASIDLIVRFEVGSPEEVSVKFFLEDASEPFLELVAG